MPIVNYHNHTALCGHATGTVDEYIRNAISSGLTELGFSDHAPIPEQLREGITMAPGQTEIYISEILEKKEIYKKEISIRLGFEVDFPLFCTFDRLYLTDIRLDYLIGSCHFIDDWPFDHPGFIDEFGRRDINQVYKSYYSIIESLVESNLFNIIGHFDLVKKFGHRENAGNSRETIERIAVKMSRFGVAAEINTAGLLKPVKEMYPADDILKIFFDKNVPITLGADSHEPSLVAYMLNEAVDKLKSAGYKKISGFEKRKRYDIPI
jgi:histidinol-phosphatase (PHP family)